MKPIDGFFSTCAQDPLRMGLAMASLYRLQHDTSLNLRVLRTADSWLEPKDIPTTSLDISLEEFQRERRVLAADRATTDIYLMADDDVLPLDADFVEKGKAIMESHPQFGVLCARAIGVQYLDYEGFHDADVEESAEAGGLYLIRKGILTRWPKAHPLVNNYDMLQADAIREAGLKVGRFRSLTMNHIGLCYSTATHNYSGYAHA